MKKEIHLCDNCRKRTDDRYAEKGWIILEEIKAITVTNGRKLDDKADLSKDNILRDLEFCCTSCLVEFIEGKKEIENAVHVSP